MNILFTPSDLVAVISKLKPERMTVSRALANRLVRNRFKGTNVFDNLFDFSNEHMTHDTKIGVLLGVDVVVNQFYSDSTLVFSAADGDHQYQVGAEA